jgi:hypothetical protein
MSTYKIVPAVIPIHEIKEMLENRQYQIKSIGKRLS